MARFVATDISRYSRALSTRRSVTMTFRPLRLSTRTTAAPLYRFGGGLPDPASFPYDALVEATARMMKEEGAEALTYGEVAAKAGSIRPIASASRPPCQSASPCRAATRASPAASPRDSYSDRASA